VKAEIAGGLVGLSARILITAVSLCLAVFMLIVMGNPREPQWWLFMLLVVAWNISPLIAAGLGTARRSKPLPSSLTLTFAMIYISVAGLVYYHDLYPRPVQMHGFIIILFPLAGWVGLTLLIACVDFAALFWTLWRAYRLPKSRSDR